VWCDLAADVDLLCHDLAFQHIPSPQAVEADVVERVHREGALGGKEL
jgi:hypothetical protein